MFTIERGARRLSMGVHLASSGRDWKDNMTWGNGKTIKDSEIICVISPVLTFMIGAVITCISSPSLDMSN